MDIHEDFGGQICEVPLTVLELPELGKFTAALVKNNDTSSTVEVSPE